MYELPSIKPSIRYLHGAAVFPAKRTWFESIWKGNYLSWPLVNVKNVNKFFADSEETQKGHMKGQRQCVRSTELPLVPDTVEIEVKNWRRKQGAETTQHNHHIR